MLSLQTLDERRSGQVTENSCVACDFSIIFLDGSHLSQSAVLQIRSLPELTVTLALAGPMVRTHGSVPVFVAVRVNTCLADTFTFWKPTIESWTEAAWHGCGPVGVGDALGDADSLVNGVATADGVPAEAAGEGSGTALTVAGFGQIHHNSPTSSTATTTTAARRIQ